MFFFLRLNGIAKIKNAKIEMLHFGAQIAKISNRRKYLLYGITIENSHKMDYICNFKVLPTQALLSPCAS